MPGFKARLVKRLLLRCEAFEKAFIVLFSTNFNNYINPPIPGFLIQISLNSKDEGFSYYMLTRFNPSMIAAKGR